MRTQLKISGKKHPVSDATREQLADWSFEKRPGGWVIATLTRNGVTKRMRFAHERVKNQFWSKVTGAFIGHDFFGERLEATRAGASQTASDLTAQFPGKVRKIMVAVDQEVEANTPLLMVEAMKMEFAIKAPAKGTVKKVLVTEGQQLTPGQLLIDFEEAK